MDCSLPVSSGDGIFQARILEWVAISFPRGSSPPPPTPGIFPTQGSNPGLPHCRQTLYRLSYQGSLFQRLAQAIMPILPTVRSGKSDAHRAAVSWILRRALNSWKPLEDSAGYCHSDSPCVERVQVGGGRPRVISSWIRSLEGVDEGA